MSNMTEKCDRNKNEEHDGGVHRHARKNKKAIIKEWLCDMSELFRPFLAHGGDCLLQHHRLSFRPNSGVQDTTIRVQPGPQGSKLG